LNISPFDQSKEKIISYEGEAIRLSNELRAKPFHSYISISGERIDIPAVQGFDCETCTFMDMVNWLADTRIKKSESLIAFVHRIMSIRFPTEYAQNRDKIQARYKLEYEMIQSNSKNDIEWFGEVGFSNKVRLDGSLTDNNNRVVKQRNDEIKIVRN